MSTNTDMVNHPPHYNKYSIECIEITEHLSFCLGNCVKYIYRAGEKGNAIKAIEDIKKAIWYLNRAEFNNEDFTERPLVAHRIKLLVRDMDSCHDDEIIAFRDDIGLSRDIAWHLPEKIGDTLLNNLPCEHDASMSRIEYAKSNFATLMIILKIQILDSLADDAGRISFSRVRRNCENALEFLENLNKNFEK